MTTTNKNNKKSFRIILTRTFVLDTENDFNNEKEAYAWVNQTVSNGEFDDLVIENGEANENWEVLEIDAKGNVI